MATAQLSDDVRAALDKVTGGFAERHRLPLLAWGVGSGGEVVAGGGPLATPLRIASMTKSFTAAAVLSLRDQGLLRLDDPLVEHLPWAARLEPPTADGPPLTIRHLLTMDSGLANDDPWADRLLACRPDELTALLAGGATFAETPGVAFHYSNLGYVVLGQIVAGASGGARCQDVVTSALLEPLGLAATTWAEPPGAPLGQRLEDGELRPEGAEPGDGEFAPLGGLWSTVEDLARWVGFFCDAYPPRDDPDDGPLRRASRREMQQVARSTSPLTSLRRDGRLVASAGGYGMGLVVRDDLQLGRVVGHGGGLPGWGSFMSWLPERDVGFVGLANLTYAPIWRLSDTVLRLLADREALPSLPPRPTSGPLAEMADRLARLLARWDDAAAEALFSDNVFLDEAASRRRRAAAALAERCGPWTVTGLEPEGLAAATFTLAGQRASASVTFSLAPLPTPRIQQYEIDDSGDGNDGDTDGA